MGVEWWRGRRHDSCGGIGFRDLDRRAEAASLPPPSPRPPALVRSRPFDRLLGESLWTSHGAAAVAAAEGGLASRRLPTVPDRDRLCFRPRPSVSLSAPPWLLPLPPPPHRTTTTTAAVFSLSLLPPLPLVLSVPSPPPLPSFGCFLPSFIPAVLHYMLPSSFEAWKFAERTGAAGE